MKTRWEERYGEAVIIASLHRQRPIVCFRSSGQKILSNSWYDRRLDHDEKEHLRTVRTAAVFIKEDIKSKLYDSCDYSPPKGLFDNYII